MVDICRAANGARDPDAQSMAGSRLGTVRAQCNQAVPENNDSAIHRKETFSTEVTESLFEYNMLLVFGFLLDLTDK